MKHFWSDPHLDRTGTNVLLRPFANKAEMSWHLMEELNLKVNRSDELIILGDFCDEPKVGFWRQQIICRNVWLVVGNHDASMTKLKSVFGEHKVKERLITKCCGQPTVCSHYFEPFCNRSHRGWFMLYGHLHDQRESWIDEHFPGRRSQDAGVDTAKRLLGRYTCFSEKEIYDSLIVQPGSDPVEYYEQLRGKYIKDHTP